MTSKQNSKLAKVYLDTTIIASRYFGNNQIVSEIRKQITNKEKAATTYVKMEIWRTFLRDIIFVHSILNEEQDIKEALLRIQKIPFQHRVKNRCIQILAKVSDNTKLRLDDAIARLEQLIMGLEYLLFHDVKLIQSGTNCPLSSEKVEKRDSGYFVNIRCTRNEPNCNVSPFLKTKMSQIESVISYISSHKIKELEELKDLLEILVSNPDKAQGKNCKIIGDLIICLDAPNDYTIFSTNVRDFQPICTALNLQYHPLLFK